MGDKAKEKKTKAPAAEMVEVGSLEANQRFYLKGVKYGICAVYPFAVMAGPLKPKKFAKPVERLPVDTLVSLAGPELEPAPAPAPEPEPE
jgi:hypothetical protein